MSGSQKRALRSYRARLAAGGLARFEVLGRDADRALIRKLARLMAGDGGATGDIGVVATVAIAGGVGFDGTPHCYRRIYNQNTIVSIFDIFNIYAFS